MPRFKISKRDRNKEKPEKSPSTSPKKEPRQTEKTQQKSEINSSQAFFVDFNDLNDIPSPKKSTDINHAIRSGEPAPDRLFTRSETRIMNYTNEEDINRPRAKIDPDTFEIKDVTKIRPEILLRESTQVNLGALDILEVNQRNRQGNVDSEKICLDESQNILQRSSSSASTYVVDQRDSVSSCRRSQSSILEERPSQSSIYPTTDTFSEGSFTIPNLPTGKYLKIHLDKNFGDDNFIALSGLSFFNSTGHQINPTSAQASGPQLNESDPRSNIKNLINQNNSIYGPGGHIKTKLNCFKVPFSKNNNAIKFEFYKVEELAMVRFYNYCFSRVQALKGVKSVRIYLDENLIFRGELESVKTECVLFTTDESVLELVSKNDPESIKYEQGDHGEEGQAQYRNLPKSGK